MRRWPGKPGLFEAWGMAKMLENEGKMLEHDGKHGGT